MRRFTQLAWYFYQPLLIVNLVFTGCGLWAIFVDGLTGLFPDLMIKLLGYAASTGYRSVFAGQPHNFYHNAGYRLRSLYGSAYLADLFLFLLLIYPVILLSDALTQGR